MSKLEDLLAELCPNGVEYKKLSECCNILDNRRKPVTRSARVSGKYPYYGANGVQDYVSDYIFDGIFVLVGEDGSVITNNGNPVVTWATGKIWVNNHAHIISEKHGVIIRYLYYYIQTVNIKHLIHGNIPKLTGSDFKKIKIAVPPLPVQEEIVRILDNFAELTAELTKRKQQYQYYRDMLLTFADGVEYKTLGQIALSIYRGSGITRDQIRDQGIPCVRYGEIYTTYDIWFDKCVSFTDESLILNKKYFGYGDVLFAITGENVEDIAKSCVYVGKKRCLAGGDIVVMKHSQNPKYLSYALSTKSAQAQKSKGKVKSKVVHSSVPSIQKILIPVPPLAEQARIVSILDHFDALCNDLTSGLPAEIEARKKQYEYYRDKLLTFKEAV